MSGVFLLPLLFAHLDNEEEERKERRELIALEKLKEKVKDEKTFILTLRALPWKSDEDIVATYDEVLNGNLNFNSMATEYILNVTTRAQTIGMDDFFAFLSQVMGRKETIRIINENHLFKRTLETHPEDIHAFIRATNCHMSEFGRYNGHDNGYMVENDIFENREKLFYSLCLKQKENACPLRKQNPLLFQNWLQEQFFSLLEETRPSLLKTALAKDCIVPAIIMASGDKTFLKDYRDFLMKDGVLYKHNEVQINAAFALAEKESQKQKYQNLFIEACPAVQRKRKWGFIPYKTFDVKGTYECPIIAHALSGLTKTHE